MLIMPQNGRLDHGDFPYLARETGLTSGGGITDGKLILHSIGGLNDSIHE
jgi:hypothetical protein